MSQLIIKINHKNWSIEVEGQGYRDGKCVNDADELNKILNATTESQELKPEYKRIVNVQRARL